MIEIQASGNAALSNSEDHALLKEKSKKSKKNKKKS